MLLNYERFHDPFQTGYNDINIGAHFKKRIDNYGLFNWVYVIPNFIYLFLQGFHVQFDPPDYIKIRCLDPFGTSLTFASPFVFLAFWAVWKRSLLIASWIAILSLVIFQLFYFSNGSYQINGQRYTLDYMPLLIMLVALALNRAPRWLWQSLISYSILMNLLARFICGKLSG